MGGYACRKTHHLLHNISHIHAIELLLANTALALFEHSPSPRLTDMVSKVRRDIAPLLEDRYYGPDIAAAHKLVIGDLQSL
jgi:histidine ammonia-lyase